jgi:serine/threonine-protein kinase
MGSGDLKTDPAQASTPAPGVTIAGKYTISRVVASGGMGVIVEAWHDQLAQPVAIKFLLGDMLANAELVARFMREARAAARLHGEHVVRVLDVGQLETGGPYMVMEYLRGHDLRAELGRTGVLGWRDAVDYLLQACEALAEAHALGIVHRDIKPGNLYLTKRPDGSPLIKVLDFGISKLSEPDRQQDKSLTATAAVLGSPQYMSPEQVRDVRGVDARSDIWSLGITLYELVTGEVPFDAETIPALSAMIVADPPVPPRRYRDSLPEKLEAVILRCLEKDPNKRFQDVAELAMALKPLASSRASMHADRAVSIRRQSYPDLHADELSLEGALQDADTMVVTGSDRDRQRTPVSPSAPARSGTDSTLRSATDDELTVVDRHGSTLSATATAAAPRPRAGRIGLIAAALLLSTLLGGALLLREKPLPAADQATSAGGSPLTLEPRASGNQPAGSQPEPAPTEARSISVTPTRTDDDAEVNALPVAPAASSRLAPRRAQPAALPSAPAAKPAPPPPEPQVDPLDDRK